MTTETRYTDKPGQPFGEKPTPEHPYVVEVKPVGESSWGRNGLSFATAHDADGWGFDLLCRWFGAESYRVVDTRTGEVVAS